jgi:predicted O-methyltransferase YrrM
MSFLGKSALHAICYLLYLDEAHSQTTEKEQVTLQKYAQSKERAVEIGVHEGVNTRLIAEVLSPSGVIYAVDPFFTGRIPVCWGKIIAQSRVRRGNVGDSVRFVRAPSWEACERLTGTFDFIFIDGDHSLEGIRRDWADWSGRIRSGGLVALHDTCVAKEHADATRLGSHQFFEQRIQHDERFELIEQVDSLSIMQRL